MSSFFMSIDQAINDTVHTVGNAILSVPVVGSLLRTADNTAKTAETLSKEAPRVVRSVAKEVPIVLDEIPKVIDKTTSLFTSPLLWGAVGLGFILIKD